MKLWVVITLGMLITGAFVSLAGDSEPAPPSLYFHPSELTVHPGDNFTLSVMVNGSDIYAIQYKIVFDPTAFEVVSQTQGTFLSSDGTYTIPAMNTYDNTNGTIDYGESRTGTTGITGEGVVATIQFHVKEEAHGQYTISFDPEYTILSDPSAQAVEIELSQLSVNIESETSEIEIESEMGGELEGQGMEKDEESVGESMEETTSLENQSIQNVSETSKSGTSSMESNKLPGFPISLALASLMFIMLLRRKIE